MTEKKEFIYISNWKELNGKQLHVIVVEDGGFQSVSLYEEKYTENLCCSC